MGRVEAAAMRPITDTQRPHFGALAAGKGGPEIKIFESDEHHCVGSWGDIYVMVWRRDTVASTARRVHADIVAFARTHKRIGVVTLIEERASLPPADARKVLAALMNEGEPYTIRSAVVCEGTGFRAAAFRAASTGIALLANYSFPHRVFASVELGGAWLVKGVNEETGATYRVQEISRVVNQIRGKNA
jgi:hypothetical protein